MQATTDITDVKVARISALQAVTVALITAIGAAFTGYIARGAGEKPPAIQVVPVPDQITKTSKLADSSSPGISILKDISIFDLRSWRQVPPDQVDKRYSPVNYINYLHVKKTRPEKRLIAHYATGGSAIDLRCITHGAKIYLREDPEEHAGSEVKEYAVEVDIEDVPVGKEFLVVIEATYWNSFQDPLNESASTYTDDDIDELNELALIILLPESKTLKG